MIAATPRLTARCVFPTPGGRSRQNVFPMSHKASRRQFTDVRLIECWLKGEVKLIERLHERKASQACFHGHIPLHTGAHFHVEHPIEKLHIGPTLFGGFFGELIQTLGYSCQRAPPSRIACKCS